MLVFSERKKKKIKICLLRIAQFYFRALLVARITLIRPDYIFAQEHCAKIKLTRKFHELLYAEFMITEALENINDGIKIGGELVAAVRYANDQAMMSHTNAVLQRIMDALNDAGKDYGMKINRKKDQINENIETTRESIQAVY